jgi:DedD protein
LAGTAVVVLLLVIFVPMLLEEEPGNPVPEADLQIPPRPAFDEGLDRSLAEPPAETFAVPSPPGHAVDEDVQAHSGAPELPPAESFSAPSAPLEPEPEPIASAPPPEPQAAPEPVPPPPQPPKRDAASAALSGWVIQVAALAEASRAAEVERDLRAKGFPAFVEEAVVNGKTYFRVRVGPEIDRKKIEAMAASVQAKTGLQGQVRRHP